MCEGDTTFFGVQDLTTAGTYTEIFASADACDSTVVFTLSIDPLYIDTTTASICDGDNMSFGSQTLTTAGTYSELYTSVDGCDSTKVLTLSILPTTTDTAAASICDGDTTIFGSQTLTAAGTFSEVYTNADGCDSTKVMVLSMNQAASDSSAATICSGETYTLGAQSLTTAGTYSEVFQSAAANGCDSTQVLTLTVNSADTAVTQSGATLTAEAVGAVYQWIDCDDNNAPISGKTNQNFTASANGNYAVIVTENNCTDTSSCYNVTGFGIVENSFGSDIKFYPNPTQNKVSIELDKAYSDLLITVTNLQGQELLTSSFNNKQIVDVEMDQLKAGVYFIKIDSDNNTAVIKIIKE